MSEALLLEASGQHTIITNNGVCLGKVALMVQADTLLIPLLMGLFLVAVAIVLVRTGPIRTLTEPDRDVVGAVTRLVHHPASWVAGFLVLSLGFGGGIILAVSGEEVPAVLKQTVGVVLVVVALGVLAGFLFSGVYGSARARGLTSAQATAIGGWGIGLLFLGAVVVKLIMAG